MIGLVKICTSVLNLFARYCVEGVQASVSYGLHICISNSMHHCECESEQDCDCYLREAINNGLLALNQTSSSDSCCSPIPSPTSSYDDNPFYLATGKGSVFSEHVPYFALTELVVLLDVIVFAAQAKPPIPKHFCVASSVCDSLSSVTFVQPA